LPGGIRDVLDTEDVAHILCQEPRLTVQIDDADALGLDAAVVEEEVGQLLLAHVLSSRKDEARTEAGYGCSLVADQSHRRVRSGGSLVIPCLVSDKAPRSSLIPTRISDSHTSSSLYP
jgi:hypothetical protein